MRNLSQNRTWVWLSSGKARKVLDKAPCAHLVIQSNNPTSLGWGLGSLLLSNADCLLRLSFLRLGPLWRAKVPRGHTYSDSTLRPTTQVQLYRDFELRSNIKYTVWILKGARDFQITIKIYISVHLKYTLLVQGGLVIRPDTKSPQGLISSHFGASLPKCKML